jgi:hypothetical protein
VECGLPRFELEGMVHMISEDEEQEEALIDCTLAAGVGGLKGNHREILFFGQVHSCFSQCTVR